MRNINCKPHWLAICCLSRIFFFSRSTVQKLENNMMIVSVNHANNNLCTWQNAFSMHYIHKLVIHHLSIGGWFKRMELIEVKSLIWAQKGKLYIIYENVMWIQWPTIPVWWQKKRYCSDMPNVVSAIDGTSHEIQIPSNEPQQKTYFQQTNSFHWMIWKEVL